MQSPLKRSCAALLIDWHKFATLAPFNFVIYFLLTKELAMSENSKISENKQKLVEHANNKNVNIRDWIHEATTEKAKNEGIYLSDD